MHRHARQRSATICHRSSDAPPPTPRTLLLHQTQSNTFKTYQTQVMSNCQAFATGLQNRGYELAAGGTDNHLLLMNLRPTVRPRPSRRTPRLTALRVELHQ